MYVIRLSLDHGFHPWSGHSWQEQYIGQGANGTAPEMAPIFWKLHRME
jgi:hypothetical protein